MKTKNIIFLVVFFLFIIFCVIYLHSRLVDESKSAVATGEKESKKKPSRKAEEVGKLVNFEGDVSVKRGKKIIPAKLEMPIFVNDKIITGRNSKSTLILTKGENETKLVVVQPSKEFHVRPDLLKKRGGIKGVIEIGARIFSEFVKASKPSEGKQRKTLAKRGDESSEIVLLSPKDKIISTRPEFYWDLASKVVYFTITIKEGSNQKLIVNNTKVTTNHFQLSSKELKYGKLYSWQVKGYSKFGYAYTSKKGDGMGVFKIISKKEAEKLKDTREELLSKLDACTAYLLLGKMYRHYELYIDAISMYRKALKLTTGKSNLQRRRDIRSRLKELYENLKIRETTATIYEKNVKID